MKRILVTGAGGSAAYNFIDSLRIAEEPLYIVGADAKKYHLELAPVDKRYIIPRADDPNYISAINKIIEKEKIDFIHAQPDIEVEKLSENREKINSKILLPDDETLKLFANKMKCNEEWVKNKVRVPEAYYVTSSKNLEENIKKLFKNHEKVWLRATHGAGSRASLPVKTLYHAEAWIDYWKKMRGLEYTDFMISEFLPGKEFAFQSLWENGELITSQARERIEYIFGHLTPSGQSSSPSVAKTVHRDDINEVATKAIKTIAPNATGVFCVDMKEDSKGRVCLIEVNAGRFFTTSNFFAHAGSNMPYLLIKMAFGEKLPVLPKYNAIPKDLYWVRMIDMGYKIVEDDKWTSNEL